MVRCRRSDTCEFVVKRDTNPNRPGTGTRCLTLSNTVVRQCLIYFIELFRFIHGDSRSLCGRPALALIRPLSRFQGAPDDHQSSGRQPETKFLSCLMPCVALEGLSLESRATHPR